MKKDWKIIKIPEVLFFQEGPGVRKSQFTSEGVKLLNVGNINNGKINLNKTKIFISEKEAYGKYKHFLVDDGDLVIASSGIVVSNFHNKIAFIRKNHLPLCMNTSTIRFKVKNKKIIDINYFKYFLKTNFFSNQLQRLITGSAQLNFGPSHLKKIDILLPPIKDQKRIVKILDKADVLRQKRKQAIDLLDDYLMSVFLEIFGDPVRNPKKWEIVAIKKIIKKVTNESPKNNSTKKYSYIDISCVDNVSKKIIKINDIIGKNAPSRARQLVVLNDIIISTVRPNLNAVASIRESYFNPIVSTGFCVLRSDSSKINHKYLFQVCILKSFVGELVKMVRGANYPAVSDEKIKSLKIGLPPIALQNKFSEIMDKTEDVKQKMLFQLNDLDSQFQVLMHKAFKGEL